MKLINLIIITSIAFSGAAGYELSACNCCCAMFSKQVTECSTHKVSDRAIFKPECCCSFKSVNCKMQLTLNTPPSGTTKIEPVFIKYNSEGVPFYSFLINPISKHNREGPFPDKQFIYTKTPTYLLNCSILC